MVWRRHSRGEGWVAEARVRGERFPTQHVQRPGGGIAGEMLKLVHRTVTPGTDINILQVMTQKALYKGLCAGSSPKHI